MRQVATFPEEQLAQRLVDYLFTLQIETRILHDPKGWEVWVCDEDKVEAAREEVMAFRETPEDSRFVAASSEADQLRREAVREEAQYQQKQEEFVQSIQLPEAPPRRVTATLIIFSLVVAFGSDFGKETQGEKLQALFIAPYREVDGDQISWAHLSSIEQGEVWRLVTPIFIHFGPLHLAFNLFMLFDLGGLFERKRGPIRFLLFVLVAAVLSNLGEYYLQMSMQVPYLIGWKPNPQFGGMSGVLYAIFGYLWMKSRYDPRMDIFLPPFVVVMLIGWFFLCLTGAVGPIANVAHGVGLLVGIVVGFVPTLWAPTGEVGEDENLDPTEAD